MNRLTGERPAYEWPAAQHALIGPQQLQLNEMNLEAGVEFLQQLELIEEFNNSKNNVVASSATKSLIQCKY